MRIMGTVVGFICGGGIAVGCFFAGMFVWPPESVEGSCQVTSITSVTVQCAKGNKGRAFKLNMANVTFGDGSTRLCNTFWLTDNCGLFGSDKPIEVLHGEARPCRWFESEVSLPYGFGTAPAGACVEPGHVEGGKSGSIVLWILGVGNFCFWLCCCSLLPRLCVHAKGDKEDTGAHDAKGDNKNAIAHPEGEAASATDAACV
eukprot:gnl/TRDRNA2_/TRDRNA2_167818_c0_seq1.p1 gnl/TRDRNA2_/TRDRNA2_167818_c0~~gnl/TRDRNA2_/TRDRNA2_167818_c0_seq1.p1  ORF type:complete len:202 (-),score=9.56 gnl/TRDRNA2_/TRDRNA2_167818_c0_seq1:261-866(-)